MKEKPLVAQIKLCAYRYSNIWVRNYLFLKNYITSERGCFPELSVARYQISFNANIYFWEVTKCVQCLQSNINSKSDEFDSWLYQQLFIARYQVKSQANMYFQLQKHIQCLKLILNLSKI